MGKIVEKLNFFYLTKVYAKADEEEEPAEVEVAAETTAAAANETVTEVPVAGNETAAVPEEDEEEAILSKIWGKIKKILKWSPFEGSSSESSNSTVPLNVTAPEVVANVTDGADAVEEVPKKSKKKSKAAAVLSDVVADVVET